MSKIIIFNLIAKYKQSKTVFARSPKQAETNARKKESNTIKIIPTNNNEFVSFKASLIRFFSTFSFKISKPSKMAMIDKSIPAKEARMEKSTFFRASRNDKVPRTPTTYGSKPIKTKQNQDHFLLLEVFSLMYPPK